MAIYLGPNLQNFFDIGTYIQRDFDAWFIGVEIGKIWSYQFIILKYHSIGVTDGCDHEGNFNKSNILFSIVL